MATEPRPAEVRDSGLTGLAWRWLWGYPLRRRLFLTAALLFATGLVLWQMPTPYYITAPGSAHDAAAMVRFPAAVDRNHAGRFLVLTVNSRRANLFWYLYARVRPDPRVRLEPTSSFLGYYPDYEHYYADSLAMMEESRRSAVAAALRALGYPVSVRYEGVRVTALMADSPAAGVLAAGDRILAVDGRATPHIARLAEVLRKIPPGQPVPVTVDRAGRRLDLLVPSTVHPNREGAGLRVLVRTVFSVDLPMEVEIDPGQITGPSGGLIFSLEIVEQLTGESLSGGAIIAGTGTVDPEGRVGTVGGVTQKVYTAEAAGAEILLVPRANYAEARAVASQLEVVGVDTVRQAVDWLRSHQTSAAPLQGLVDNGNWLSL